MTHIQNTPSAVAAHALADAPWRTSTRSQTANCVEVAPLPGGPVVALRDSKDRAARSSTERLMTRRHQERQFTLD
jgi:hypothetical protein